MQGGFMIFTANPIGSVYKVELKGRFDAQTALDVDVKLKELFTQGHTKIVVDLSQVDYISSSGLRVLLGALKECRKICNGDCRLAVIKPHVKQIFEMAGFTQIFKIHDTVEEAIKSFQ
jgi:anti-sigma B factor antagonist